MDSREQDHIKKMLRMHKRRLYALELQQAWHGINTSPEILMEIEDLKENIERFQSQIDAFPQIDDAGRESANRKVQYSQLWGENRLKSHSMAALMT